MTWTRVATIMGALLVALAGFTPGQVVAMPPAQTPEALYGTWTYVGATQSFPSGRTITARVSGEIRFSEDGTWSEDRQIGSIFNPGQGQFFVEGDQITLTNEDPVGDPFTYTFALAIEETPPDGYTGDIMTLSFSDDAGVVVTYGLRKQRH